MDAFSHKSLLPHTTIKPNLTIYIKLNSTS
nr:MAG TPA: hypothetical protein [Caudoviricetes sp.]